jgi:Family of unknown function (DUF5906)
MDAEYVLQKNDPLLDKAVRTLPKFNTFCGFAIDRHISQEQARQFKYDPAKVDRILAHIDMLVNGDQGMKEYFLRWEAAPLQRRGYRTGVMVIHRSDKKGVGKGAYHNMFMGGKIYGDSDKAHPHYRASYAQTKDINYVVGDFNEGVIAKVRLNLDECGIFDGATKQNEKLKGLITEPRLQVNQKHLSLISYENSLNMVLTVNKDDPVKIEAGDRRFFMIESETKKPLDYFRGPDGLLKFLLESDAFIHWYAYLMQLDMEDFYLIEPPMTAGKQKSMARSLPVEIKFLQALCLHVSGMPKLEKVEVEYKDNQVKHVVLCGDEALLTNEFIITKKALEDAYTDYCNTKKLTNKGLLALLDCIKKNLKPNGKAKPVHFKDEGTVRPILFPTLRDMEAQLRSEGAWDENFDLDMTAPKQYGDLSKGLYWGDGIKST